MSSGGGSVVIELDVATGGAIRLHLGEEREDSFLAVEATPIAGDRHVVSRRRPAGAKSFEELLIRERAGLSSHAPRLRRDRVVKVQDRSELEVTPGRPPLSGHAFGSTLISHGLDTVVGSRS